MFTALRQSECRPPGPRIEPARIRSIIAAQARRDAVADSDRLREDLGFDSLDQLTLVVQVEYAAVRRLPDSPAIDAAVTVGDFVAAVLAAWGAQQVAA